MIAPMAEPIRCERCGLPLLIEYGMFGQCRELSADGKRGHYVECVRERERKAEAEARKAQEGKP
jgi:hypothetical protein